MTIRRGKVIVDTNLLMQVLDFRKCDVYDWVDNVYENIYIHIEVVNEFKVEAERKSILDEVKKEIGIYLTTWIKVVYQMSISHCIGNM